MHELTKWCIEKIKREYPEDIALLIGIRGHSTNGDGHGEIFDYFVPCTDRGYELSRAFIVEGVGHDLYPRSWERLERSVSLDEMITVLKNGFVLYARSPEDEARFKDLQKRLEVNLANPLYTHKKATELLHSAEDVFSTLMFEEKLFKARNEVCGILLYLSQAVAFVNGTSADEPLFSEIQAYDNEVESQMYSCPNLLELPDSFFRYAGDVISARNIAECRKAGEDLIRTTKHFLEEKSAKLQWKMAEDEIVGISKPDVDEPSNLEMLAEWYQELSLTWRRIRYFTENNMVEKAYCDACNLQSELIAIAEEFGIPEYDLLDSFDAERLELLRVRADRIETEIHRILTDHGVKIDEFATLEDFLASEESFPASEATSQAIEKTDRGM